MDKDFDWENVNDGEVQLLKKIINSVPTDHNLVIEFHHGSGYEDDMGQTDDSGWEITESIGTRTLTYATEYSLLRTCESFLGGGYGKGNLNG